MTLLVPASAEDVTMARFAEFAGRSGVPTLVTSAFDRVTVSVRAERDRTHDVRILVDGAEVRGVLNRGPGPMDGFGPSREFAAAEAVSAWWSTLALWPGPVINRPARHGFFPEFESREPSGSARARRYLVAGAELFDLDAKRRAAPTEVAGLRPVVDRLNEYAARFLLLTVEPDGERLRLVEASCWPVEHEFAGLEEAVYAGLLEWFER
ncbi:MAG: hypothetical protein HOW71_24490 [Nonomuraea sp.]|nr:hypothetical protein [Nonomuraea sp.]NUP65322.1 hypothetical protein [Nonomuraea sp.]